MKVWILVETIEEDRVFSSSSTTLKVFSSKRSLQDAVVVYAQDTWSASFTVEDDVPVPMDFDEAMRFLNDTMNWAVTIEEHEVA